MSGTVADKATAFKNEVTGSTTNKIVCKASNHDIAGPKKKHVDYLINLTNDPHCNMGTLSDLLFERLKNTSWVVVFKDLIVAHNLMTLGNERFLQCVATRANSFSLDSFTDRSDPIAVDMSVFARRYAKYLAYMCTSYKSLAMDLCRMPKGEESPMRTMDPVKLLKTTAAIQQQLDLMLDMEVTSGDLTNGVINTAFLMMYKDLIKLYTVYNDAIINILEKFFEMKKPQCKEAIGAYRKFITRQEGIHKFLQLAEDVGVDRQSHLNLRQVPEDLLPALESHLADIDSIKKTAGAQPSPQIKAASEKLAKLHTTSASLSSEEKASTPLATSSSATMPGASDEVLEAQRKRFEELKRQATLSSSSDTANGPSTERDQKSKEDLLFDQIASTSAAQPSPVLGKKEGSGLHDLVGLQGFTQAPPPSIAPSSSSSNPFQGDSFSSGPWNQPPSGYQEVDLFSEIRGKPQPDFDSVFGSSGGPQGPTLPQGSPSKSLLGGEMLMPEAVGVHASMQQNQSVQTTTGLTTDVESSLAKAAENLSLTLGTKTGMVKKTEHQWKPSGPSVKTGGDNFVRMQIQPKTLPSHPQPPTSQSAGRPANWSGGMQGHFPLHPTTVQPAQPFMQPTMGMGMGMGMPQQQMWQQPPPQQQQDLFRGQPSLF